MADALSSWRFELPGSGGGGGENGRRRRRADDGGRVFLEWSMPSFDSEDCALAETSRERFGTRDRLNGIWLRGWRGSACFRIPGFVLEPRYRQHGSTTPLASVRPEEISPRLSKCSENLFLLHLGRASRENEEARSLYQVYLEIGRMKNYFLLLVSVSKKRKGEISFRSDVQIGGKFGSEKWMKSYFPLVSIYKKMVIRVSFRCTS